MRWIRGKKKYSSLDKNDWRVKWLGLRPKQARNVHDDIWVERKAFLILPKTIGRETRWLEIGHWVEKVYWYDSWELGKKVEKREWIENAVAEALTDYGSGFGETGG